MRAAALQRLLDEPPDAPEVVEARSVAMETDPIRSILASQNPAGWWAKPGPGYGPKYQGTIWQVVFLDQLGADANHPQVARACDYVLTWCPTATGGFGSSAATREAPPPPSSVIHCLNGNLVRALVGFGRLGDERLEGAIEWSTAAITGSSVDRWYASGTSGPLFACAANEGRSCAWGAIREMGGLARIPEDGRSPRVREAIDAGVEFLFSRDPAAADYPMGWGNTKPNGSWFRFGFPSGYVSDVMHTVEVLIELGHAGDERLRPAVALIESRQDKNGRWVNQYAYNAKTWIDIEKQGAPSKWVTLRACTVLRAVYG